VANATGEVEAMAAKKDTFRFKIVNDDLNLAQECLLKLTDALYAEELQRAVVAEQKTEETLVETVTPTQAVESGWGRGYKVLAVLAGLVIVHEIVRNRNKLF